MIGYYDRAGRAISLMRWGELFENRGYKFVARSQYGDWRISTVWLGMDHGWGESEQPLIFETMVFHFDWIEPKFGLLDRYMERYTSIEEALQRHDVIKYMVQMSVELGFWETLKEITE